MKRLFWIGLGAAVGIIVARRVTRAAESLTPAGISQALGESVRELGDSVRYFTEQVRQGMAEREIELYEALGVLPDGRSPASPDGAAPLAVTSGDRH